MPTMVHASGTFAIGGELVVHRLGFGAMRLPGAHDGNGGAPGPSRAMLREAVRLGTDFIDTAHAYGLSEELVADALHPYPDGLVIATKGGLRRGGSADGRPERLRSDCEESLRRLRLDTIDVWQLHAWTRTCRSNEQLGARSASCGDEGKIRFVGLSEVTPDELEPRRAGWSTWQPSEPLGPGRAARENDVLGVVRGGRDRLHAVGPDRPRGDAAAFPEGRSARWRSGMTPRPMADRARVAPAPLARHAADPRHGSAAHMRENIAASRHRAVRGGPGRARFRGAAAGGARA